jgi:succinate dehydrogenase / fumarate reductase cytochrome b subunit
MQWFTKFLNSSVGQKWIVGITGLMLVGFLLGHISGNLLVFVGPEALNSYAKGLKDLGPLLWVMRLGLLGAFALHIVFTIKLSKRAREARPTPYHTRKRLRSSFASAYMLQSGFVLLAFVIYHLAHYTWLVAQPEIRAFGESMDVYSMLVGGFSVWYISLFYILAMGVLMLHLNHGASSFFQSLGLNHPQYNLLFRRVGPVLSVILFLAYAAIPVSVQLGLIK